MTRGYSIIAADKPKDMNNFSGLMRAGHCYGAKMLVLAGNRYKKCPDNTSKAERHIPFLCVENVFDALPMDCVPVAIDLLDGATPLYDFIHPERAFYIFGAEDSTLDDEIVSKCKHKVFVPTNYCMNLAATANVVLYDRMAKEQK
jgi:tRNA(Leu) C34 or U34 (ribose-2'-O)-methylase TrmL